MSAASKGKALYSWRVREQVARGIAHAERGPHSVCQQCIGAGINFDCVCDCPRDSFAVYHRDSCQAVGCKACAGSGSGRGERALAILAGAPFNVHAAREHALGLVELADEQDAFEDWTRERGLGPERSDFSHGACSFDPGPQRGGWPGNLAREWALQGGDRRAPMGRSLARLGQHILDAIEVQASECKKCELNSAEARQRKHEQTEDTDTVSHVQHRGADRADQASRAGSRDDTGGAVHTFRPDGAHRMRDRGRRGPGAQSRGVASKNEAGGGPNVGRPAALSCPDCQGTGHNLRGVLPPAEVSPQLRRRGREAVRGADSQHRPCQQWLIDAFEAGRESGWVLTRPQATDGWGDPVHDIRTRVTPRGEHRHTGAWPSAAEAHRRAPKGSAHRRDALDRLISERLWDCYSSPDFGLHWPRWRRGELKHAQQRRGAVIRAGSIRVVTQPGPIRVTCEFSIE